MLFLLLSGAIFGACSPDKDRVPVFVKNVVMPPDSWVFAPGDGVTVSAEGFEADDEIMLEIHWQESAEGFAPEGYAKGVRGIVTVRSATSVTFLAPGHYPASTVRVLLLRRGRMMPLGKIRVANGTPKAEALYGISKSDTDETLIERIDLSTGGVTRVATLGIGRGIACAVGLPGSGWIYGVCSGSMAGFDLTMNYYDDFGYRNYLFAGQVTDSSVGLISHDAGRLTLTTRSATRSPSPVPVSWQGARRGRADAGRAAVRAGRFRPAARAAQCRRDVRSAGVEGLRRGGTGRSRRGRCDDPLLDRGRLGRRAGQDGSGGRLCRFGRGQNAAAAVQRRR